MARLPIVVPISDVTFETAATTLAEEPWFACIDAGNAHPRTGRYSVLAARPVHTFSLAGGFITVDGHTTIDTPHAALSRFCARVADYATDPYLPFSGGILGYISFEGARALRGFEPAGGFSRLPQVMLGIYAAAVIFDHAEGVAFIVANGPGIEDAKKHVAWIQDRLASPTKPRLGDAVYATKDLDFRMLPDDGSFRRLVDAARSWVRAESAGRIHLARHSVMPIAGRSPIELFFKNRTQDSLCAIFVHEGAAYIATSSDLLLEIRGKDPGPDSIDSLVGSMPPPAMTGSPCNRAINFIERNETAHRTLYGGCFGMIDAAGLSFWTANGVQTIADGALATTAGEDVTADTDSRAFFTDLSARLMQDLQTTLSS